MIKQFNFEGARGKGRKGRGAALPYSTRLPILLERLPSYKTREGVGRLPACRDGITACGRRRRSSHFVFWMPTCRMVWLCCIVVGVRETLLLSTTLHLFPLPKPTAPAFLLFSLGIRDECEFSGGIVCLLCLLCCSGDSMPPKGERGCHTALPLSLRIVGLKQPPYDLVVE